MVKLRHIPGFEGYAASRDGRIWSKRIPGANRIGRKWKALKGKDNKGYRYVTLYEDGLPDDWPVHQLILLTFVGPLPEGQETRHKNGIRNDNRLENLHYGTRKQNAEDCVEHGTQPHGATHGRSKLTEDQAKEIINYRINGVRNGELAEMYGVSKALISLILHGRIWTHLPRPDKYVPIPRKKQTPAAWLTEEQVIEIRKMHKAGWLQREIADRFEVSQTTISHIIRGDTWSHVS